MGRPFEFSNSVRFQARFRQRGRCACCGHSLDDLIEHGHHVIPNQSGSLENPLHAWLRQAENCVVLCEDCHNRAHENGRFRSGAVAPASYFAYSHGSNRRYHAAWAAELRTRAHLLFSGMRS